MTVEFETDDFEDEVATHPHARELRPRVLVAEDDESLRELIVTRLRREAFETIEASSGHEALNHLSNMARGEVEHQLDLVIMDIRMPGTSGLDVARILRAADWSLPILLITAFPTGEVVADATRLNLRVLAKPFGMDRLSEAAIATLLAPQTLGVA